MFYYFWTMTNMVVYNEPIECVIVVQLNVSRANLHRSRQFNAHAKYIIKSNVENAVITYDF